MSKLTTSNRNNLPSKDFGLPETREYPMEDKAHARNAKARASMAEHEGHITKAQEEKIDHKADRKLGENVAHKMLRTLRKEGIKEHEQSHWGKGK